MYWTQSIRSSTLRTMDQTPETRLIVERLDSMLSAKQEEITYLRRQLNEANERDRENRRIIAALTQRIPSAQISPPDEPPHG